MKAVVVDAPSLLGSSLVRLLRWEGHTVAAVVNSPAEGFAQFQDDGIHYVTAVPQDATLVFDAANLRVRDARFNVAEMIGPGPSHSSPLARWIDSFLRNGSIGETTGGTCIVDVRDVALAMLAAAEAGASGEFTLAGHYARYDYVLACLQAYTGIAPRTHNRVELYPGRHLRSTRVFEELCVDFRPLDETLRDIAAWNGVLRARVMVA